MIGLAIREVTLSEIDKVFQLYDRDPRRPITKIRLGKGVIVYKESVNNLIELKSKVDELSETVKFKGRDAGFRVPRVKREDVNDYIDALREIFNISLIKLREKKQCALCSNRTVDRNGDTFTISCQIEQFSNEPIDRNIECEKFE